MNGQGLEAWRLHGGASYKRPGACVKRLTAGSRAGTLDERMSTFDPNAAATPGSGVFGLPFEPEDAAVVLVPVPWEATTSYGGGTAGGPAAILAASHQVDLFDLDAGRAYERGIAMLAEDAQVSRWNREARALAQKVIAVGGEIDGKPALVKALARVNALSRSVNAWVERTTGAWLDRGKIVGVVGGDHSVPLGAIAAYGARFPGLGVLHLDAHSDTRVAYEGFTYSHASIMERVLAEVPRVKRLVQVGIRDFCEAEHELTRKAGKRVAVWFDAELDRQRFTGRSWDDLAKRIVAGLPKDVYLSWDIDGLDPTLCPHTGTPVPGGLSFAEAVHLLRTLVASGRRIVGFDLNEVAPGPDGDEWDANVGARLLYKMCLFTLISQAGSSNRRRKVRR